jgi:hypothetical protein
MPQEPGDTVLVASGPMVFVQGVKRICLPAGGQVPLSCVHIFTFRDDLILEHRVEYDTLRFFQLLALPTAELSPALKDPIE